MARPKLERTTLEIFENTGAVSGNLLLNAFDPDGDTISIARVNGGAVGTNKGKTVFEGEYGFLTILQNGDYTYTLKDGVDVAFGQSVVENFTVKVRDGTGNYDQDHLMIEIKGVEDAPTQPSYLMDFEDTSYTGQNYNGFGFFGQFRTPAYISTDQPDQWLPGAQEVSQPGGDHVLTALGTGWVVIQRFDMKEFGLESGAFSSSTSHKNFQIIAMKDNEVIQTIELSSVDGSVRQLGIHGADTVLVNSTDPNGYNHIHMDNLLFTGGWLLA